MSSEKIRKPSPKNNPKKSLPSNNNIIITEENIRTPLKNTIQIITIYVDPQEGLLSYHRSSDGRSFPLQLFQDNRFKIRESEPFELKNGIPNEYDILKIHTKDGIPTYQLKSKQKIIAYGGGGGRRSGGTTVVPAYAQAYSKTPQTINSNSPVTWDALQANVNVSLNTPTKIRVGIDGDYQFEWVLEIKTVLSPS